MLLPHVHSSHPSVFTSVLKVHAFTAPSGAPQDVRVAAGGPHSLLVTWRAPDSTLTHGALRGYTIALRRQNLQGHLSFITRPVTGNALMHTQLANSCIGRHTLIGK